MLGNEYQELAMRTNDNQSTRRLAEKIMDTTGVGFKDTDSKSIGGILNGCLGLSGESGEFNDIIKKWLFHEKPLDEEHAKRELSDCMWYIAMICESFGWRLDEVMKINVDKLMNRYPDGFDIERANNRVDGDV